MPVYDSACITPIRFDAVCPHGFIVEWINHQPDTIPIPTCQDHE